MVDLPDNADVGRLLAILHAKNATIAALCTRRRSLLAAPERLGGQWLFEGVPPHVLHRRRGEPERHRQAGCPGTWPTR